MNFIFYGLCSAFCWGTSDFAGGLASRRIPALLVTLLTNVCGLVCLVPVVFVMHEQAVSLSSWTWCMMAGAVDSVALVILYAALAKGHLLAAPLTALTASVLPVVVGIATDGLPRPAIVTGLALALIAVLLLSRNGKQGGHAALGLSFLSGVLTGLFLIMMHKGTPDGLVWPLVATRTGALTVLLPLFAMARRPGHRDGFPGLLLALIVVFEISGTICYVLSGQTGRMDVAAVLSSLYPGMTVFLSFLLFREKIMKTQAAGVLVALVAIMFMTGA
jgi:drug/metabolite transporter (DMT)-like permease